MDEATRITMKKFLLLILVAYCVGVSSFTVVVGVAGDNDPSCRSSKSSAHFSDSTKTMSSNNKSKSRLSSASTQSIDATCTETRLPWRDTNYSPLTGNELRTMAVEAAMREEEEQWEDGVDDVFLDVPGVAWMEHLNLIVGHRSEDRKVAEAFYIDVMGMTPDKSTSFHVNLGRQQFHLATPKQEDEIPHRIHGSVGIVVPDLEVLWGRLTATRDDDEGLFGDTLFDFYREDGATTTTIHVRCPWGNVFRCYSSSDRGIGVLQSEVEKSPQKMSNLHASHIGVHGADKMGVLSVGQPGIRYVEFILPVGAKAEKVCEFYKQTLHTQASVATAPDSGANCCLVSVGPGVHLVYVEAPSSLSSSSTTSNGDIERELFRKMVGIHVCIYVHNFHGLYKRLKNKSLIWTNPRFTRLDRCDTWEDSRKSRTLRFKHVIDETNSDSNEPIVLMTLEHETRALRHGQFMKAPYYVPK